MDCHYSRTCRRAVVRDQLLKLEIEHARLALDLRLAEATDIDNDQVSVARLQLEILERQIGLLSEWLAPPVPARWRLEDAMARETVPA
jgi:hypothetical protein